LEGGELFFALAVELRDFDLSSDKVAKIWAAVYAAAGRAVGALDLDRNIDVAADWGIHRH
jgi:hypothetical protein